jgi:hypothetical protein
MAEENGAGLMAKKPPVAYASLDEGPEVAVQAEPVIQPVARPAGQGARTLKEVSAHIMTYIHPDAAKALKRYAVENNCKVHDLCLEAFEDWFRAHGLREKVRADPRKPDLPGA